MLKRPCSTINYRQQFIVLLNYSLNAMEKSLDRMSSLPDSLIHYILTLMPMKCAVRTSILSSRWRDQWKHMWIHTTTLDFGKEFAGDQMPEEFAATVNRYLRLHNGKRIETFRLYFDPGVDYQSDAAEWIEFTVTKGVTELDLNFVRSIFDFEEVAPFNLPDCFFDCPSLNHLNLSGCRFSSPSYFNGFSFLKCLKLKQVDITDEMVENLVSNCPLLNELILRECFSLGFTKISGPDLALKFLAVIDCSTYDIEISAPNLQSFHFCGDFCYGYSFKNTPSLTDALFNSIAHEYTEPEHDYMTLLSDLDYIKVLTVSDGAPMYITTYEELRSEDLPISLHNLQELQLVMPLLRDEYLSSIYCFFKNCICPCLERLFIDFPSTPVIPYEHEYCSEQHFVEEPSACTFNQLKAIKINGYRGHSNETRLLRFVLQNAILLERVVLVMAPALKEDDSSAESEYSQMPLLGDLREQLLLLPKASSGARIALFDYSEDDNSLVPIHTDLYCKF